jgi:hypothetical protein
LIAGYGEVLKVVLAQNMEHRRMELHMPFGNIITSKLIVNQIK